MKRFRALPITALIIILGTSTAFADIVSIDRTLYHAKWYIAAAVVVIIIAIVLLMSVIKKRAEKTEDEVRFIHDEGTEILQPAASAPDVQFAGSAPEIQFAGMPDEVRNETPDGSPNETSDDKEE